MKLFWFIRLTNLWEFNAKKLRFLFIFFFVKRETGYLLSLIRSKKIGIIKKEKENRIWKESKFSEENTNSNK